MPIALAAGAIVAYLLVFVAVVLAVPEILASVLISGVGEIFGVAVGIGVAAHVRSES